MSVPKPPEKAKLVMGAYMQDRTLFGELLEKLGTLFGGYDMISAWLPFGDTDYYEEEMGHPLWRRLVSFEKLIEQLDLSEIKKATNNLEKEYLISGNRRINIDPGYMLSERFVLATGKNFSHRIHVGEGIYADLTLIYRGKGFQSLPWTYPDYVKEEMTGYLERIRAKYRFDLEKFKMEKRPDKI
ncbi:DUF4416 family protein [Desulforegula conservatrix]|uniref:DUF4416 family protein n=1 Tax=Desulforegula conservatrix TaxID=153026 RepID=UPI00042855D8|nr:DUF4416 family protein [Desulforegula conservatrix]